MPNVVNDIGSLCPMEHMKHHEMSQMEGIAKGPKHPLCSYKGGIALFGKSYKALEVTE